MNKLDKNTLSEYKKLRRNNPEIIWVQEFFREYVKDVLETENKVNFDNSDFDFFKWYFENIKTYNQILVNRWINLSIEETKLMILWQNIDDFSELINKYSWNIKHLFNLNKEVIKYLFSDDWIIEDKSDLKKFINHYGFKDFILFYMNTYDINIVKLLFWKNWVIKSVNEIGSIYKSWLYWYIISWWLTIKILNWYMHWFSYNNIWWDLHSLFPVRSSWSVLLMEIENLMEKHPEKDIHEILKEKANNYLENNKIKIQEKWKKEIAIYLRYWRTVNYPEIWETIIIFLQEAIKKWIIKWVKGIKILPKTKYIIPRNNIIDKNTRFCNVEWDDFVNELNNNSIPFYLSHSSNEIEWLGIISWSMEKKNWQINLWLELEKSYDELNTDKKSINEIFDIIIWIIKEINSKTI